MTELIIIKTPNSKKVQGFLSKEQINYQVFSEQDQRKFSQEDKLLQEYRETWKNLQRLVESKQWEQVAMNDWVARKGEK